MDIDGYIAAFPDDVRDRLGQMRKTIRKAAPNAREAIKYGIPTWVQGENLVHFAAFQRHIGFYPSPSGIEEFQGGTVGFSEFAGRGPLSARPAPSAGAGRSHRAFPGPRGRGKSSRPYRPVAPLRPAPSANP